MPQKSEHKRLKIDLSGLHPLDELKPTKFDTKDATLYAANDKAIVVSDTTKAKKVDYSLYGQGFSKELSTKWKMMKITRKHYMNM